MIHLHVKFLSFLGIFCEKSLYVGSGFQIQKVPCDDIKSKVWKELSCIDRLENVMGQQWSVKLKTSIFIMFIFQFNSTIFFPLWVRKQTPLGFNEGTFLDEKYFKACFITRFKIRYVKVGAHLKLFPWSRTPRLFTRATVRYMGK